MANAHTAPSIETLLAHSEWLCALARELVAEVSVADDMVQETWLKVIERPPRTITNARRWLAAVLRNVVRDHARGKSRRTRRERATAREEAVTDSDVLAAEAESGRALIGQVLALDELYRTILLQRFWKGMEPIEIARAHGIPLPTVKTRLARGLERLRTRLDASHGGSRRSWAIALLPLVREGWTLAEPRRTEVGASKVGPALIAALVILAVVTFVAVRSFPNSKRVVVGAAVGHEVESDSRPGVEIALLAGPSGSDREPITSANTTPLVASASPVGAKDEVAPVVILGDGLFDPESDGPRAIALDRDGSLIAFEYGERGQCLVFDSLGTIRAGVDSVGYCSEAVCVGASIFLTVPSGRILKFGAVSLRTEGNRPVSDKKTSWLCDALCASSGVVHVGSGDEGRVYMFDMNLEPHGSWGSFESLRAMDAAGERIFVCESGAAGFSIRAFRTRGTDTPMVVSGTVSISGVLVDLCALDMARVLVIKEDGQLLQYQVAPADTAIEQWTLLGQANLAAEQWFTPSNGISRAAYDTQRELLYISFRSPYGRIVAVPYSAREARRVVVRK